ncbi:hypothetical protein M231_04010 [Tremella mesenterica]|uniref:AB hydrolase-1 domain-containing protein n=1 Tax=Tremella mesenterica TaxID=5217 RepID=A0A4Q1BLY9_TREME|nr:hypothetical protein M231_04010 [Tremella mesenterica]
MTFIDRFLSIPSQILFALLGLIGMAQYSRQIVRVTPRDPADIGDDGGDYKAHEGDSAAINVARWVEENVPSLKGTFKPSWWLPKYYLTSTPHQPQEELAGIHGQSLLVPGQVGSFGETTRLTEHSGHFQTIYSVIGDFTKVDKVEYRRTYLRVPDGGTMSLDFAPPNHTALPSETPIVVICHGITGGSHESYVRSLLVKVVRPVSEGGLGLRGVVMNFRACAGTPLTSPQLYSAGTTIDLATTLHYLRHTYPSAPLHGVGFSLGASVLSRYLGESSSSSLLSSGLVLGCPWDVTAMTVKLETHLPTKLIYSRALGRNLLALFFRDWEKNKTIWESPSSGMEDYLPKLKEMRKKTFVSLKGVDEVLTSKIGGPKGKGLWPFKGADEYYTFASPRQVLDDVKRPLLSINAFDDPIIDGTALPIAEFQASSHVYAAITGPGGHLGWFCGPLFASREKRKARWIVIPAVEWLTAASRDLPSRGNVVVEVRPSKSTSRPVYSEEEGQKSQRDNASSLRSYEDKETQRPKENDHSDQPRLSNVGDEMRQWLYIQDKVLWMDEDGIQSIDEPTRSLDVDDTRLLTDEGRSIEVNDVTRSGQDERDGEPWCWVINGGHPVVGADQVGWKVLREEVKEIGTTGSGTMQGL